MSRMLIHSASYENVREAVDRAFELFPIAISWKKVLIKPNVLRSCDRAASLVIVSKGDYTT